MENVQTIDANPFSTILSNGNGRFGLGMREVLPVFLETTGDVFVWNQAGGVRVLANANIGGLSRS